MSLLTNLQNFCLTQGLNRCYWIAYSGGLDSHVLLHLLAQLRARYPLQLRAIHVNHNLSPNAQNWARHCEQVCAQLDIALTQQQVNANATIGESPENAARMARYAAMMPLLAADDILLTAHHQDDQAETLLLQLCRGAGPKGLAAMPAIKKFGKGYLGRPWLDFPREKLRAYAEQNNLSWIEDESNTNINFARNFIRHDVLPVLQQRWPMVSTTLARAASNCGEAQHLLDEMAAQDTLLVAGSISQTLSVSRLLTLSAKRQRQVLRFWLRQLGFTIPGIVKLKQIQLDMLSARADKQPLITWRGVELRRYRDNLYALAPLASHDAQRIYPWDLRQPLSLAGVGELHARTIVGDGLSAGLRNVTVRFRRGGEVCRLPARTCSHDLKKLFQTWQIPVWERDRIPLIYTGEQLIAAVGWFVDPEFIAKVDENGYVLSLN
jgi:tRNA(Ile)-lysidine synthase